MRFPGRCFSVTKDRCTSIHRDSSSCCLRADFKLRSHSSCEDKLLIWSIYYCSVLVKGTEDEHRPDTWMHPWQCNPSHSDNGAISNLPSSLVFSPLHIFRISKAILLPKFLLMHHISRLHGRCSKIQRIRALLLSTIEIGAQQSRSTESRQ